MGINITMDKLNAAPMGKPDSNNKGKKEPLRYTNTFKVVLEFYVKTIHLDFSYN